MRIAKFIARSGHCSRREAEKLLLSKQVTLNHQLIENPTVRVDIKNDCVKVGEKTLSIICSPRLWIYNKPRGVLTACKDERGRRTLFESLPKDMPRVISVGRLDYNTQGLILLTNYSPLARHLELPSSAIIRVYKVKVAGRFSSVMAKEARAGLNINNVTYRSIDIRQINKDEKNICWLEISLREGKNREVRKVLEHFGMRVLKLIRVRYADFYLGDLCPGVPLELNKKYFGKYLK